MSDKELDDLFREAADGVNISQDQSEWSKMSARLDEADRTPSYIHWKTTGVILLIGLIGFVGVYTFRNIDDKSSLPLANELAKSESIEASVTPNEDIIEPSVTNSNEEIQPASNKFDLKYSNTENDKITKPISGFSPSQIGTEPQDFKNENYTRINSAPTKNYFQKIDNREREKIQMDSALTKIQSKNRKQVNADSTTISDKFSGKKALGVISIKASLSPDFSSIKFFTPDHPGSNYGIQIGYSMGRWSVFTGAISSRKIYTSTEISEAYTSPRGYDYPIKKLSGDCRVLDIPLNVYYQVAGKNTLSLTLGMGFSSYLMLEEDYTYYVDNPYPNGRDVYTQSVYKKNNEWFKMMNFSVLVQKRLSNHFSLEVEPFVKTPIAGIGEGDVSLVTLGSFVNLRYNFSLHRKL